MSIFTWIIPAAPGEAAEVPVDGVVDHVAIAIGRLRAKFRGKTTIEDLVRSLLEEGATVEAELTKLRDNRSVDTATGVVLNMLGALVGEPRRGDVDDDYRRRIRARIAINRSSGMVEDIIRVVRLVLSDEAAFIRVYNGGTAEARVTIEDVAVDSDLADQIGASAREAIGAGIRLQIVSSSRPPETTLRFDTASTTFDSSARMADTH